jgi:hypothetical protein
MDRQLGAAKHSRTWQPSTALADTMEPATAALANNLANNRADARCVAGERVRSSDVLAFKALPSD